MGRPDHPITLGVRFLREHEIDFVPHLYRYQGGGTRGSAEALGVDHLRVAKTLLFEDETGAPLVVVMNGPFEVGTKQLARHLGRKRIEPCAIPRAESLTGYKVGGISPFGQRTPSPTYLQIDLFEHETILVNGGQRGFLVEVAPEALEAVLQAEIVDVAVRR
ncbi:MAG: YbaK/EbsC family protein [Deltaproteobacteria bacterium]|nr:YbaK/EbsC family protein [Deltaproteobacteria bacterium]